MLPITYGNILAVYFSATDLEGIEGARWYDVARESAAIFSGRYGVTFARSAAVIAALSPNNRWDKNLDNAEQLIKAYYIGGLKLASSVKVATFNNNKNKALNILNSGEPLDILGGLKVRAFYDCILGGNSVCIDGHAYAIWQGRYISATNTPKITPKAYELIAADYRLATIKINNILSANYSASQIQAITWLVWRRMIKEGAK